MRNETLIALDEQEMEMLLGWINLELGWLLDEIGQEGGMDRADFLYNYRIAASIATKAGFNDDEVNWA